MMTRSRAALRLPPRHVPPNRFFLSPTMRSFLLPISEGYRMENSLEIQAAESPLARLVIDTIGYAQQSRAPNTQLAYRKDWRTFERFCQHHGFESLPASPETVALFIGERAAHWKVSTIRRAIAAISVAHKVAGHYSPASSELARSTLLGVCRVNGSVKSQKAALRVRHIREGVEGMRQDLKGVRDRAIILIAYAAALRRSELVGLDFTDVQFRDDGMIVYLRRSKTDSLGEGTQIGVQHGTHPATCPVEGLRNWLSASQINCGALFRPVAKGGRLGLNRLSDKAVCQVVKDFAKRAGLPVNSIGGHSLRSGLTTDAFSVGLPQAVIARHSRHRSSVISEYLRESSLFETNVSGLVGL